MEQTYEHTNEWTDWRSVTAFPVKNCGCLLSGHHTHGRSRPLHAGEIGFGSRSHRDRLLYRCDRSLLPLKPMSRASRCQRHLGPRGVKVERSKEQTSAAGEMIP